MALKKIQTLMILYIISAAIMLTGCGGGDESATDSVGTTVDSSSSSSSSSTSSSSSSSGVTIATDELSTALSGYVKTFSSSSSSRSAGAVGETGVKSLVQLYLLIDESYKYPVAKVKSKSDGSFTISIKDVKEFLLDTTAHASIKTDYNYSMPSLVTALSSSATVALPRSPPNRSR